MGAARTSAAAYRPARRTKGCECDATCGVRSSSSVVAASDVVTGAGAAAATKRPSVVSSLGCGRSKDGQRHT